MRRAEHYYSIRCVGALTPAIKRLDRRLFPANGIPGRSEWWEVRNPDGELVAYAAAEAHGRLCHLTRCGVRKSDRGRRLQRILIRIREKWGRRQGCVSSVTYARSTNYASVNSLLASGYRLTTPATAGIPVRTGRFLVLWRRLVWDLPADSRGAKR